MRDKDRKNRNTTKICIKEKKREKKKHQRSERKKEVL